MLVFIFDIDIFVFFQFFLIFSKSRRHIEFELMIRISTIQLNWKEPWNRASTMPPRDDLEELFEHLGHEMLLIPNLRKGAQPTVETLKSFMQRCMNIEGHNLGGGQGGSRFFVNYRTRFFNKRTPSEYVFFVLYCLYTF